MLTHNKLFEEKEIVERDERTSTLIGRNMRYAFFFLLLFRADAGIVNLLLKDSGPKGCGVGVGDRND